MNKENMTKQYSNPQFEVVSIDNRVFFSASGVVKAIVNPNLGSGTVDPHINSQS